jgi:transcriptional regulator with XRE-family HTH domain
MLRALARTRRAAGLSQQAVAVRKTSQSQVAMLESGAADPKLSTLERYLTAMGLRLSTQIEDAPCPERAYVEATARA